MSQDFHLQLKGTSKNPCLSEGPYRSKGVPWTFGTGLSGRFLWKVLKRSFLMILRPVRDAPNKLRCYEKVFFMLALVITFSVTTIQQSNAQNLIERIVQRIERVILLDSCVAGGEGTSCSITVQISGGTASANAGGNGSMTITYSVSCQPGYYACCNLSGSECKND